MAQAAYFEFANAVRATLKPINGPAVNTDLEIATWEEVARTLDPSKSVFSVRIDQIGWVPWTGLPQSGRHFMVAGNAAISTPYSATATVASVARGVVPQPPLSKVTVVVKYNFTVWNRLWSFAVALVRFVLRMVLLVALIALIVFVVRRVPWGDAPRAFGFTKHALDVAITWARAVFEWVWPNVETVPAAAASSSSAARNGMMPDAAELVGRELRQTGR